MSGFLPLTPEGGAERSDRPDPRLETRLTEEERRSRWEVRAAQWRAIELARAAFGGEIRGAMLGIRGTGPMRGLLHMSVPFGDLEGHRRREARFLSLVHADPLLSKVPLVYVVGPDAG
jgi:hypothetical protein